MTKVMNEKQENKSSNEKFGIISDESKGRKMKV
jgi:hypothetical protein